MQNLAQELLKSQTIDLFAYNKSTSKLLICEISQLINIWTIWVIFV